MIKIGQYNTLKVIKEVSFGLYLDGQEWGDILLPNKYVPQATQVHDEVHVFIYFDSENKIIATTLRPRAQVNRVAFLKVVDVNHVGAFLDWGLDKDLFVPRSEQRRPMEKDRSYLVYVSLDRNDRIIASSKLDRFLEKSPALYHPGDEVHIFIAEKTDLGHKVIIDNMHWGLIYAGDICQILQHGQRIKAFIKTVRPDGKIDVCLRKVGQENIRELSIDILDKLKDAGGFLPLHDKSLPADINHVFGASKKSFKSAIGQLYKQGQICIEANGIRLVPPPESGI
ncbi:MAG: GntR family transcriptional regulator [Legionellaceae bacterium]|nr:GntR family transcriptional regulator [Legionellaceae bacterium]